MKSASPAKGGLMRVSFEKGHIATQRPHGNFAKRTPWMISIGVSLVGMST